MATVLLDIVDHVLHNVDDLVKVRSKQVNGDCIQTFRRGQVTIIRACAHPGVRNLVRPCGYLSYKRSASCHLERVELTITVGVHTEVINDACTRLIGK